MFNGALDRWDFKLVGKKEIIIPYNTYKLVYDSSLENFTGPEHINSDLVRWEKHRVWVVEATVKEGKRHLYSKQTFYIDEDSWFILAADKYDGSGQLYRAGFAYMTPSYDVNVPNAYTQTIYDFVAKVYITNFYSAETGGFIYPEKPYSKKEFTPSAMTGAGVR